MDYGSLSPLTAAAVEDAACFRIWMFHNNNKEAFGMGPKIMKHILHFLKPMHMNISNDVNV